MCVCIDSNPTKISYPGLQLSHIPGRQPTWTCLSLSLAVADPWGQSEIRAGEMRLAEVLGELCKAAALAGEKRLDMLAFFFFFNVVMTRRAFIPFHFSPQGYKYPVPVYRKSAIANNWSRGRGQPRSRWLPSLCPAEGFGVRAHDQDIARGYHAALGASAAGSTVRARASPASRPHSFPSSHVPLGPNIC